MAEPIVFLGGKYVPADEASINIYDHGIVLGATATEFTRTFSKKLYRLDDHLTRLYESLKYMRLDPGLTIDEMREATLRVAAHNAELLPEDGELALVHFVTPGAVEAYAGSAAAGIPKPTPTVCIHTFPLLFWMWQRLFQEGAHVVTPSIRHVPPQCIEPKMKHRSRMNWYLADGETHLVDPKAITLLLDLDGNVTESSGANFLIAKDEKIISPTSRNILRGISRKTVMELCGELGISFVERDLQVHDVVNADEAFLCTTPYCLAPVTRINGIPIGDGIGPMFHKLIGAWSEKVGLDIVQQIMSARRPEGT